MRHRLPRHRDVRLVVDVLLMANLITMQALMILAVFTSPQFGAHLLGLCAVVAGAALGTAVVQAWPRAMNPYELAFDDAPEPVEGAREIWRPR